MTVIFVGGILVGMGIALFIAAFFVWLFLQTS